jgi:putative oxidoreductase
MDPGRAILRFTIGPLFIGHGTQKLFGWFGGHGLEATGSAFEGMGMRPGRRHATAAGLAETAGGALVTLGLLTPLAASLLSGVMVTAIRKVHARNGVWATGGGFEYNAVLIGALAALVEQGPGRPSLDAALWSRLRGPALAVASIGAGAAGSFLGERMLSDARFGQRQAPGAPPSAPGGQGTPASAGAAPDAEATPPSEAASHAEA